MITFAQQNGATAVTMTPLRIAKLEFAMLEHDSTSPVGLIDAIVDVIEIAESRCSTPGCDQPKVDARANDALSALGLTSTKCEACTAAALRRYLAEAA